MGHVPTKPVTIESTKMKERDEKHEKGHNSLILGALNSKQVSTEHHRDEVKEPKMTWAELVSGKKKCTRT